METGAHSGESYLTAVHTTVPTTSTTHNATTSNVRSSLESLT